MVGTAQKELLVRFVGSWKGRGDKEQDTQEFWSSLFHGMFGIAGLGDRVEFGKQVPLLDGQCIDVFIPKTRVIILQESMDVDLLKRKKRSDGSELNSFEQAQRYGNRFPYSERPRWIVTCNFQKFVVYDMEDANPEERPVEILLEELPDKYRLLSFLVDPAVDKIAVDETVV